MSANRSPENKGGEQRERRRPGRVPTSCAECRRLKLRCDRKVPCETCMKRGCGAICPNGSLPSGKGNRLVLANTEGLQNKIEVLNARVRELEDALRLVQAEISDHPHPLLQSTAVDSASSPNSQSSQQTDSHPSPSENENDAVIDAFGTLTIGMMGETTFLGGIARSEYLLDPRLKNAAPPDPLLFPRLSKPIIDAWLPESDYGVVDYELRKQLFDLLPPLSEAIRLCELYIEYGQAIWHGLPRAEVFDEVLAGVYRADSYETMSNPHFLPLIYIIFAMATLFDLTHPAYSVEAQEYYILARVSLNFFSPCTETTVHTIQCLLHMVEYLDISDQRMDSTRPYIYIGLAVKLGYRMGLHLHSARWKLSDAMVQKRSALFWQMFLLDTWQSFFAGRPPSVAPEWIDCPFPEEIDAYVSENGQKEMGWRSWCWKFTKLLHHIMTTAHGNRMPSYSTIVELDRKIRDFPVPPHLRPNNKEEIPPLSATIHVQGILLLTCKEASLLNLHRFYFAQALQEQPDDLLKHKYGPSVMAAYRSAWRLIESHAYGMRVLPRVFERVNLLWSHSLSAAIVMCMLVTRSPKSSLAASSVRELDVVYETFRNAAPISRPASNLLPSIIRLWEKGHEAVDYPGTEDANVLSELNRLGGGKTRLISPATPIPHPSTESQGDSSSGPSPPGWGSAESIHPRIMQDMRVFENFEMSPFTAGVVDFPQPESFLQAMSDVQFAGPNVFGNEIYNFQPQNMGTFNLQAHQLASGAGPAFVSEVPVLDSAWQNFVEQLGF